MFGLLSFWVSHLKVIRIRACAHNYEPGGARSNI